MKKILLSLFLVFQVTAVYANSQLDFQDHGKEVKALNLEQLKKIGKPENITIFDPHQEAERTYSGFNINRLLDQVYGKNWQKTDEVLFTCADGYQPSVPVADFKENQAWLVYAVKNSKQFTLDNKAQHEKNIKLGPYYLIWNNHKTTKGTDAFSWPYQVVSLNLIDFKTKFPRLIPPGNASLQVKNGFLAFRKNCMTCHSINGEGGKKSIDLNSPRNLTSYIPDKKLAAWIANPSAIKPGTTMPALSPGLKNRNKVIQDIIAYLKAMKGK
jgi:hypothetical protein